MLSKFKQPTLLHDDNTDFSVPDEASIPSSGEKLSTIIGKITRFLLNLKPVSFSGSYNDLTDLPDLSDLPGVITDHEHTMSDITDMPEWATQPDKPEYIWNEIIDKPSSMPANDVYPWAKEPTKPSYSWTEITGDQEIDILHAKDSWNVGNYTPDGPLISDGGKMFIRFDGNGFLLGENSYNYDNIPNSNQILSTTKKYSIYFNAASTPGYNYIGIQPYKDNTCLLGNSNYKWADIYTNNSHITTSDKKQKKDISYIGQNSIYANTVMDDDTLIKLILGIKPVIFTRINADSNRPHHGLLANDFEELLQKIDIKDHAALIKSPKQILKEIVDNNGNSRITLETIENEYVYGFRYEELITDIIRFCQILYDKNKLLEDRIKEIENKLQEVSTQ